MRPLRLSTQCHVSHRTTRHLSLPLHTTPQVLTPFALPQSVSSLWPTMLRSDARGAPLAGQRAFCVSVPLTNIPFAYQCPSFDTNQRSTLSVHRSRHFLLIVLTFSSPSENSKLCLRYNPPPHPGDSPGPCRLRSMSSSSPLDIPLVCCDLRKAARVSFSRSFKSIRARQRCPVQLVGVPRGHTHRCEY